MRIQIPVLLFFTCFIFLLLVIYLLPFSILHHNLPLQKSSLVPNSTFSEERAYQLLEKIVTYGPRPLNTNNNKEVALFIVKYFETLKSSNPSSNPVKLVIDFEPFSQNSTIAWYFFSFLFSSTFLLFKFNKEIFRATEDSWSTFESTNIVIRIGTEETLNSDQPVILINTHYDSVYG